MRDCTARKQTEEALLRGGVNFRNLAESDSNAIVVHRDYQLLYANPAAHNLFGALDQDQIKETSVLDYVHHRYHDLVQAGVRKVLRSKKPVPAAEIKAVTPDGKCFDIEISSASIHFDNSEAVVSIIHDISDRKQGEVRAQLHIDRMQALRETLELLNQAESVNDVYKFAVQGIIKVIGCTRASILSFGADGKVHFAAWHGLSDAYREAVDGHCPWQQHETDAAPISMPDIETADLPEDLRATILAEGIRAAAFFPLVSTDQLLGKYMAYFNQTHIMSEDEISFGKILANNLVTALKRLDHVEALRESQERSELAQRIAHMGTWDWDLAAMALTWSNELYRIFGLKPKQGTVHLRTFLQAVHPEERHEVITAIKNVLRTGNPYEEDFRIIRPGGSTRYVHADAEVVSYRQGKPARMIGAVQDITERKLAEESIRKLSHAVTHAGGSIMISDRNGVIEYVNHAFTRITGYSAEEAIGQTPRLLKSGEQDTAFYKAMWETLMEGNVWHGKIIDRKKDGSLFPAMLTVAPIKDSAGLITHYVGSHADLSKVEEMELKFFQAQKMEALGTLVGGIAHDFNNMLAGITGNLYLAKNKVQEKPDVLKNLESINAISFRAADMIQQLLTYSRKDMVNVQEMPLAPFIKETLKFLRTSIPENISVQEDICTNALRIRGDTTQLHQVLMNLINNARDALDGVEEPHITIRLESFHADNIRIESQSYFKPGHYAHLSVADNGCGIPEDKMKLLFDPFFTTKEVGKGTGLGLSMVFGSIKTHQGFVDVESIEGEGATFHVYIPLLEKAENHVASGQRQEVGEGHGELILLADDEINVRETTAEALEVMGYKLLRATDGLEALEIFNAHQEEISLLILDVVMPRMGGKKVAERIREKRPEMPVIFITGYDREFVLNEDASTQNCIALTKPMQFDDLSRSIRKLLD